MQVKSIAECSKRAFCIRPSLSYHLSFRPLFCLFLNGRLRQDFTDINLFQNYFNTHVGDVINNKVAISVCLLDHLLTICTVYVGYDCFKKMLVPLV